MRRGLRIAFLTGALGLMVALALTVGDLGADTESQAEATDERGRDPDGAELRLIDRARKQIAAESRGEHQPPIAQAPPGVNHHGPLTQSAPRPPAGYSFTSAPSEMTRVYMVETPPAAEVAAKDLDWLDESEAVVALAGLAAAAKRDWTFGWLRLAPTAKVDDLLAQASPLGVQVVGSAGTLLRAKLPGDEQRLRRVAALSSVGGMGMLPPRLKAPADFVNSVYDAPYQQAPVIITLMANDADGRWDRALRTLGAVVGPFDADIRAYAANLNAKALDAVLAADFVQAVEPVAIVRAHHDTAVPAMGVDALRRHDGPPGLFAGVGGASVPIGVMDTGLNINHLDIASNRESICGANFVSTEPRAEDDDLWVDEDEHGTHVTGTIAGNGVAEPRYAGMAPAVAHIRFAKVLDRDGFGTSIASQRGMDFLARSSNCVGGGLSTVAVKPLIVNMSLGGSSRTFQGRGAAARKLDAMVWAHRQLYVVANANSNIHGFSNFAAAKNSLSVGAASDDASLAGFSSHGPTADGRLAPLVVATGVGIHSAAGAGSRGGYNNFGGTSMASPTVAGVAALLMDALPAYREQPALVRARLMASAIRPTPWLELPEAFAVSNSAGLGTLQTQYGLGKVSARTSVLMRDRADGWVSGGAIVELEDGEYAYEEVVVPPDAGRLDVVMTWDEPPADTIGNTVLNNLDLHVDHGGDCGAGACGEHASTSSHDNVEWVIVQDPPPGTYRIKVVPRRIYTAAPRVGVAWTVARGTTTPDLRLVADRTSLTVSDRPQELTLTVSASAYVAAGTRLHVNCRTADNANCHNWHATFSFANEDGMEVSGDLGEARGTIALGEIAAGERQSIRLNVRASDDMRLYFVATAWNAEPATLSVAVSGDADSIPALQPPANDDFAAATRLTGASGERELDLALATTEPGEPPWSAGRPRGTVWYQWVAAEDGLARFAVANRGGSPVHVDVFRGDAIAGLVRQAGALDGASFFAEQDVAYRIRVSYEIDGSTAYDRWRYPDSVRPLTLYYSSGPRPVNDDFAAAIELTGATGRMAGNNQGATLEPGEQVGSLAATVWYRWRAEVDGGMRFSSDAIDASKVLVFTGSDVASMRLVSGSPGQIVDVPVRAGDEYRVAVAAGGAHRGGRRFELEWRDEERDVDNDDFANAEAIEGVAGSASLSAGESVEPGEPLQTGVQTRWWVWTAPKTGTFTWRLTDTTAMGVTAFTASAADPSFSDLTFVGGTGLPVTTTEFSFGAREGSRYWLAAGWSIGDLAAFDYGTGTATLEWGETPVNDALANAAALSATSSSIVVSNRFATVERGERTGRLGHSSLWWSYTAETAGWQRFWIEGAAFSLAVYKPGSGGVGGIELLASSHVGWLDEAPEVVEVLFKATPGERYFIRLGSRAPESSDESTLHWEETQAPAWLRYVGRFEASAVDPPAGSSPTGSLAFDDLGTTLYLSAASRLHVFSRNAESGALEQAQQVDLPAASKLVWDRHRTRLYALGCDQWRQFAPIDGSRRRLGDAGLLTGDAVDLASCAEDVFMDGDGSFLYVVRDWKIEVVAIESTDDALELSAVQTLETTSLRQARLAPDGQHVYVVDSGELIVLERDVDSGQLTETSRVSTPSNAEALAVSDDGGLLFAFGQSGETNLFKLDDDAEPSHLHTLPAFGARTSNEKCYFAAPRSGRPAADAICRDALFSVAVLVEEDQTTLRPTDFIANWQADRFNNHVPKFNPVDLATSPDGRHAYVYADGRIVIFERVGNEVAPAIAPADQAAFDALAVGKRFEGDDPNNYVDFVSAGRFSETEGSDVWTGRYAYANTGPDTGTVTLNYDDGDRCTYSMTFAAATSGSGTFTCSDGTSGSTSWRIVEIPPSEDTYVRLDGLTVSPGRVQFLFFSAGVCITISNTTINGVTYTIESSKWQMRADSNSAWADVADTAEEGRVCSLDPSERGEYRLVAEITIDDETGMYASNVMVIE